MIPASIITKAKNADLPFVLQGLGLNLCREGRGFFVKDHDSLKLFQRQGIWLYKWWSRNGEVGDGIQFLRMFFNMEFHEAVTTLSGNPAGHPDYDNSHEAGLDSEQESFSSDHWQQKAEKLIDYARKNLFSPAGFECLSFLIRERGLQEQTARKHNLGWLPAMDHMPSKLVIPCYNTRNQLIRIRFRIDRPKPGETRYRVMKGSNTHSSFPLGITPGKPVVIVESELDAILIHQETGLEIGVLALGTAANDLSVPVCRYLSRKIPLNLVSLDNDECGKNRTPYFIHRISNSMSWPVPEEFGKDPGEAWKHMSIKKWIASAISATNRSPFTEPVKVSKEIK